MYQSKLECIWGTVDIDNLIFREHTMATLVDQVLRFASTVKLDITVANPAWENLKRSVMQAIIVVMDLLRQHQ